MSEAQVRFPYRPGMDPSHTEVGELIDMLDRALSFIAPIKSEGATAWKRDLNRFLEGMYGNKQMLRSEITRFAANAAAVGPQNQQRLHELEEEFHLFLLDYMDQLPLVRHIETMQIDLESPQEALASAIYVLSLRAGADLTSERWSEAPDDIRDILREVAGQLISIGLLDVNVESSAKESDIDIMKRFAEWKGPLDTDILKNAGYAEDPPLDGGSGLPPNIPMPDGFCAKDCGHPHHVTVGIDCRVQPTHKLSDRPIIMHYPAGDTMGHLAVQCKDRGCDADPGTDAGAGGDS